MSDYDAWMDSLTDDEWADLQTDQHHPDDAAAMDAAFGPAVPAEWPEFDVPPAEPDDVPF